MNGPRMAIVAALLIGAGCGSEADERKMIAETAPIFDRPQTQTSPREEPIIPERDRLSPPVGEPGMELDPESGEVIGDEDISADARQVLADMADRSAAVAAIHVLPHGAEAAAVGTAACRLHQVDRLALHAHVVAVRCHQAVARRQRDGVQSGALG